MEAKVLEEYYSKMIFNTVKIGQKQIFFDRICKKVFCCREKYPSSL